MFFLFKNIFILSFIHKKSISYVLLFSSARMPGLNIVVLKVYFMTPLMIEVHISIWSFQLSCEELWIVCLGRYEERSDYIGSKKWLTLCHCVIGPKRERGWLDLKHFQGHSWKIILKYRNYCLWKFGYISALVSLMFAENLREKIKYRQVLHLSAIKNCLH